MGWLGTRLGDLSLVWQNEDPEAAAGWLFCAVIGMVIEGCFFQQWHPLGGGMSTAGLGRVYCSGPRMQKQGLR